MKNGLEQKASTVLTCRAPHPRSEADPRYGGRVHGVRLQVVPFEARPTYRTLRDWSEVSAGCLAVRCHSCGEFTEYQMVGVTLSSRAHAETRNRAPSKRLKSARRIALADASLEAQEVG